MTTKIIPTKYSKYRGDCIEEINGEWFFSDTKEPVKDSWETRTCGNCNKPRTSDGHDYCLGTIAGVMNACCGHGDTEAAYIQFLDGFSVSGEDAVTVLGILKKWREINYESKES